MKQIKKMTPSVKQIMMVVTISLIVPFPMSYAITNKNAVSPIDVFVGYQGPDSVSIIRGTHLVKSLIIGGQTFQQMAFASNADQLFVPLVNSVLVINVSNFSILKTISGVAEGVLSAIYVPLNEAVYVSDCPGNYLYKINTTNDEIVSTINLPNNTCPQYMAYNPQNKDLYVTEFYCRCVTVVKVTTDRIVGNLSVGYYPEGVAVNPLNHEEYVANGGSSSISVFNSQNQPVETLTGFPDVLNLVYDNSNEYMYVSNFTTLFLLNSTNSVVGQLNGFKNVYGLAYNSRNGAVYAANYGNGTVEAIRGTNIITIITVGGRPYSLLSGS
jgi:DNA-binding beta-propeller fold protein YncE